MKALLNPETKMVLEWSEKRATMDHLQEIQVSGREALSQPYDVVSTMPAGTARTGGFPVAEEKYAGPTTTVEAAPAPAPKKKQAKKKSTPKAKAHVADAAIDAPDNTDFNVDHL